jgi:phospholipid/cholesterol/gamma-HCH transport system substrate-binding protein
VRRDIRTVRYDSQGKVLTDTGLDPNWVWAYPATGVETTRVHDTFKYEMQFGKVFNNVAFRFGLFESSFGVGFDYELPFENDDFRWVSSFEAFDIRGRDRIDDQRPHFKWLNRVFFLRNLYFNFGADDFISRNNANTFIGVGLRFGDDDMKYFLSKLGVGGAATTK